MSNKQALRDLQSRLAERLQAARTQQPTRGWLAIECAGQGFLLPLREAGEIFVLAPIVPVPYSQPWFLGVANLRGHLHGVVELARFLGLAAAEVGRAAGGTTQARLIGFNATAELNCVLKVDKLAGLRSDDDLSLEAAETVSTPSFAGGRFRDASGRSWQELRLAELANDEVFLKIVG